MATKISTSSSSRSCLCSPTTHPGSFRCSRHRQSAPVAPTKSQSGSQSKTKTWDVMTNPKTSLLKAFLSQIVKPSGRGVERRRNFQPKPTRFCLMNNGTNINVANFGLKVS